MAQIIFSYSDVKSASWCNSVDFRFISL